MNGVNPIRQLHPTGEYRYRYSLTQRVFLTFRQAYPKPLDRKEVMQLLDIRDMGLNHAIRHLTDAGKVCSVPGRWGFYEMVKGATMPEDTRGTSDKSRANLKRGRVAA